jgi:outer membrane receptor protein involved in Fe transport
VSKLHIYKAAAAPLALSIALIAQPAAAQEAPAGNNDSQADNTIIVTGSRILRPTFETLEPAVVIGEELLEDRGFTNVAEALNQQPGFGMPGATPIDAQGINNVGAQYANFFGLGSQRTLTVVNGRRFVGSNAPSNFNSGAPGLQVDLNTIPLSLVDRIETISVGGAPTYGSDAIAGTVNIILKRDYEGMQVTGSYGISDRQDFENYRIAGLVGGNFADGRGNVVISVEHEHQDGLVANERLGFSPPLSFQPNPANTGPNDGIADRILITDPRVSFATFNGLPSLFFGNPFVVGSPILDAGGNILQFNETGGLVPFDLGTPYGSVFSSGGDGISLSDLTNLYTPMDRTLLTALGRYEITDGVEAYVEAFYSHNRANDQINQAVWNTDFFPDDSGSIRFNVTNPFLSAATATTIQENCTANGLGADPADCDFYVSREGRAVATGNNETRQNLFRIVSGLRGDFEVLDRNWHYDVSFNYGRTEAVSRYNDINNRRFAYALDVQALDAATIAGLDPETAFNAVRSGQVLMGASQAELRPGDVICTVQLTPPDQTGTGLDIPDVSTVRAANECVPLNYFGENNVSPEARNYIAAPLVSTGIIEQKIFEAYASGDLFNLWGDNTVSLALGYEHREEKASFQPDAGYLTDIGRNQGITATAGGFNTNEFYGELSVPLINRYMDLPVVSTAIVEAKGRYVDNNRAGGDWTYTFGGRLGVFDDLVMFRGNYTRSIRSPALVELFLPRSTIFSRANDPCDQSNITAGANPENREANCRAQAAALGYGNIGTFQSDIVNGTRKGISGGNSSLANEEADSWTIGAVVTPRIIPGLSLAVDYVNIQVNNAISSLDLTSVMQACYDADPSSYPNQYCDAFERMPGNDPARPFQVADGFVTGYANAGYLDFQGIQAQLNYAMDVGQTFGSTSDLGQLRFNLQAFRLIQRETSVTGFDLDSSLGEIGSPKWSGQLNTSWDYGKLGLFWQVRYIGSGIFSTDNTAESLDVLGVGSRFYHNIALSYRPTDNLTLQANIDNLFDTSQPYAAGASGNYFIYDQIGRNFRATAKVSF